MDRTEDAIDSKWLTRHFYAMAPTWTPIERKIYSKLMRELTAPGAIWADKAFALHARFYVERPERISKRNRNKGIPA